MKTCPFCAEDIQDAAIVCKHCGRDLKAAPAPETAPPAANQQKTSPAAMGCLTIIVLAGVFAIIGHFMAPPQAPSNLPPQTSAIVDLNASVRFNGTQFLVKNNSADLWQNVECELNRPGVFSSGYKMSLGDLKPGEIATVGAMQFAKSDGTRYNPFQIKAQEMTVRATVNGKTGLYTGTWK